MTSSIYTVLLLIASNIFMTLAWYGHLRLNEFTRFRSLPLIIIILFSWGIAFFEYCCQVPANRIGYKGDGGPFTLIQLKIIQEVVSLSVFVVITTFLFRTETFRWNHILAFILIVCAVYLVFKK
ncbi:MAG: DMT family protein [Candidatus Azobacteroides sp.]|nr:DMT family protein [Candidatus Azobacteroides sp.]